MVLLWTFELRINHGRPFELDIKHGRKINSEKEIRKYRGEKEKKKR